MSDSKKRLAAPVTLFVAIEAAQHDALRTVAFRAHRSLADVVREALTDFLSRQGGLDGVPAAPPTELPSSETIASPFQKKARPRTPRPGRAPDPSSSA
jgi:hypothetical protein